MNTSEQRPPMTDLFNALMERLDAIDERLERIEARLDDLSVDTGTGFTIEDFD